MRGAELPRQTWAPSPCRVMQTPLGRVGTPGPPRHPGGMGRAETCGELGGSCHCRTGTLGVHPKPQPHSVFPSQAWVSEQQMQCGFGLICREIFTPSFALFLASPSACQHVTVAGAAAHLVAVVGVFKRFPPSLFLLHPCSPLCSSSARPHGHLCSLCIYCQCSMDTAQWDKGGRRDAVLAPALVLAGI